LSEFMDQIVFVKTPEGPVKADDFIAALSPALKSAFATLVQQLSTQLAIDAPRAYRHENGDWSVWLEDEKGDRHNFVLYISPLSSKKEPAGGGPPRTLREIRPRCAVGKRPPRGDGMGGGGGIHIVKQFSGTVQAQLLAALAAGRKGPARLRRFH
jgi:hypothetical protein